MIKKFDLDLDKFMSLDEGLKVLKNVPYAELRNRNNKSRRELWCVAHSLNFLSFRSHVVRQNDIEMDSVDCLSYDNNTKEIYNYQVIEIAPKKRHSIEILKEPIISGYGNFIKETTEILTRTIKDKENLYSYSDKKLINLIIYFNPPSIDEDIETGFSDTVMIDFEIDIDVRAINSTDISFGSVVLLKDGGAMFLKGNKLIACAKTVIG